MRHEEQVRQIELLLHRIDTGTTVDAVTCTSTTRRSTSTPNWPNASG